MQGYFWNYLVHILHMWNGLLSMIHYASFWIPYNNVVLSKLLRYWLCRKNWPLYSLKKLWQSSLFWYRWTIDNGNRYLYFLSEQCNLVMLKNAKYNIVVWFRCPIYQTVMYSMIGTMSYVWIFIFVFVETLERQLLGIHACDFYKQRPSTCSTCDCFTSKMSEKQSHACDIITRSYED